MENINLFIKHQHGFRAGYSCVTQLIDVCDKLTEELDNKNSIDFIYLDFQKAFDSVPHKENDYKIRRVWNQRGIVKMDRKFLVSKKTASGNRWNSLKLV